MSEQKGPLTILAEPLGQAMAEHANAPPLRKNQNRAEWGAGLLAGGIYVAHSFLLDAHVGLVEGVPIYLHTLHASLDNSWPFFTWGAVMLFALLWITVGVRGSRAPRDIMLAFWALFRIVLAGVALWRGWYFDGYPAVNWFLMGIYIMVAGSSAMLLYICLRGTGRGAVRLVQQQIARQAKTYRLGRRRSF